MIDLCDSDEDVVEVMKEEKGASRNGDKENSPDEVEVIPPREPTRADLAAAAAKRRAQYEAHIASFGGGGAGGYVRGGQIVSGAPGAIGGGVNPLLNPPGAYIPPPGQSRHDMNIGTDETAVRAAEERLRARFQATSDILTTDPYLGAGAGDDDFGGADLAWAALTALLFLPPKYGNGQVDMATADELPADYRAFQAELLETRAGKHTLACYERHR